MKLKDIFNWIFKVNKRPEKEERAIDHDDPYAMIKHATKHRYIGRRSMPRHNNRKLTKGRHVQYVIGENGITKPIYHTGY
jgi:hypothetical protein